MGQISVLPSYMRHASCALQTLDKELWFCFRSKQSDVLNTEERVYLDSVIQLSLFRI